MLSVREIATRLGLRAVGRWHCSCRPVASRTSVRCPTATSRARSPRSIDRQRRPRVAIVGRIDHAIEDALDAADRAATAGQHAAADRARALLVLDRRRWPHPRPARPPTARGAGSARSIGPPRRTGGSRIACASCSRRQDRAARLHAAQRAEACKDGACGAASPKPSAATRRSARSTTPAPTRCSGWRASLARLGDPQRSRALLDELDRRFGDARAFPRRRRARARPGRPGHGTPARRAAGAARPTRCSTSPRRSSPGSYEIDPIVGLGVVERIRARAHR